jgi:hypothetical protein
MDKKNRFILNSILGMIIPASQDSEMPCARDVGFFDYLIDEGLIPLIEDGLNKIEYESKKQYDIEYNNLQDSDQKQLIDDLRRTSNEYFNLLTTHVMNCYYQHDSVLKKIGIEQNTPFPHGFYLSEWDISLLEPVYERGKCYRD